MTGGEESARAPFVEEWQPPILPTLVRRHSVAPAPAEEIPNQGKDYPHKY